MLMETRRNKWTHTHTHTNTVIYLFLTGIDQLGKRQCQKLLQADNNMLELPLFTRMCIKDNPVYSALCKLTEA